MNNEYRQIEAWSKAMKFTLVTRASGFALIPKDGGEPLIFEKLIDVADELRRLTRRDYDSP